ncbi:hypothetical protein [Sphingobium yanoikuyae]|uniref:hypothetical protein n=1 Tax=Sphingobium yanoikuyae TaxID=13690 RepID=UPI0013CEA18E|nr:hypothetical protein [Sphingobium yanoikuyae]
MVMGGRELTESQLVEVGKRVNALALAVGDPCPHCGSKNSKVWPATSLQQVGWKASEKEPEFAEFYTLLCFNCGLARQFSSVILNGDMKSPDTGDTDE